MKSKYTVILVVFSLCGALTLGEEKPAKAPEEPLIPRSTQRA